MKKLLLIILLVLAVALDAEAETPLFTRKVLEDQLIVDLFEKNWKFHPGNNADWSAKNFDDGAWVNAYSGINIALDEENTIGFVDRGWFRYHFAIDSSLAGSVIALTVDQRGASKIYLDGVLVKTIGTFRSETKEDYKTLLTPIIVKLDSSESHVLAVQYENVHAQEDYEKHGEKYAGFTISISTPDVAQENVFGSQALTGLLCLTTAGIFLALSGAHFVLFLFYRVTKSNLIFSIFNLGVALLFVNIYVVDSVQSIVLQNFLGPFNYFATSISCFALSALSNYLLKHKNTRVIIFGCACAITVIVGFINYEIAFTLITAVVFYSVIETMIYIIRAMKTNVPGAKILGTGILFLFVFVATMIAVSVVNNGLELDGGAVSFGVLFLAILAVFSIPISMSTYLAWSYAYINRNLSTQLEKVEELSAKTIEQEQEKQRLLENRKEELEQQVALRTFEVLRQKNQIELQHEELKTEKKKTDDLLLNILPSEVAEELKESGYSKARHFDQVSVLFTDFVNFTSIAEKLSPEVLVQELHECFRVFDEIMNKYGMEKIKTIGDAYLAVSGLPQYNNQHALHAVSAALEIVAFVRSRNSVNTPFDIRIGIHSGSLVAGIVGVKKFAYDIWGDTVNTASRMESNSLPGRVNISESTYQLVKECTECEHRGQIHVKNKGNMEMYFVNKVISQ